MVNRNKNPGTEKLDLIALEMVTGGTGAASSDSNPDGSSEENPENDPDFIDSPYTRYPPKHI